MSGHWRLSFLCSHVRVGLTGELAHHYRYSGHPEQAVVYLQRAGRRAHKRSATGEAICLLTTGLELLQTLPATPKRSRQELDVQITLGQAQMAAKGQEAPEVEQACTRARTLCEQVGDTAQLHWVLRGLRGIYEVRGELAAEACFQQALAVARLQQAKSLELRAATSLSRLWQHQGKRHVARQLLAEVYGWFTEGFDTPDLQGAKALLEALSG